MRGLVIACLCRVGGCWLCRGLVAAFTPRVWCYDTISRPIVQCMETRSRPEILIAAYVLVFNLQFLCSVMSTLSFMLAVAQVYLNHLNDDCLLRGIQTRHTSGTHQLRVSSARLFKASLLTTKCHLYFAIPAESRLPTRSSRL